MAIAHKVESACERGRTNRAPVCQSRVRVPRSTHACNSEAGCRAVEEAVEARHHAHKERRLARPEKVQHACKAHVLEERPSSACSTRGGIPSACHHTNPH